MKDFLRGSIKLEDKNGKLFKKEMTKGCGTVCENTEGSHTILCPPCKTYVWHEKCLQSLMMQLRGENVLLGGVLKFPHCLGPKKL